ncbi:MAG TPA: hypothetical protein VER96_12645 [Polyangiaceae bacterium]|nr:hypothetical protein [Polyangiaceae bacterium]
MRVRPQRSFFVCTLALSSALVLWTAPALGQMPEKRDTAAPPAFVFGSIECPDPKTVQQAVLNLIPPERHSLLTRGVRVELEDLGDSYRVTVWKDGASVKKSYSDPARECDGRARFAAVFTVLTLMPPELGAEPVVEPEPKPEPPKPPPPVEAKREAPPAKVPEPQLPPLLHIELSALYANAPGILEAPNMHSFGGELRLAIGRGVLAGTISTAYMSRAKFELDGVHGELSRIPLSLGARLRADFDSWSLAGDLGLSLAVERVHATNLHIASTQSAANFGLNANLHIARQFGPHFAPFVGAFVWFTPAPSEMSALPQGAIGNLPYFWLGGAAGVSFGL